MAFAFKNKFTVLLFSTFLILLLAMNYTWLFYHSIVTNPRKGSYYSVFKLQSNVSSSRNWSSPQARQPELKINPAFPRCETPVFLVIVILSAPRNFEQRSAIRTTWAEIRDPDASTTKNFTNLVKTVFLLGQTIEPTQSLIEAESKHYKDIVTGSFTDSYRNLTLKTKLGLEWAHQYCSFMYYLKTDDDVFVYTKGLVKWLWQLPREKVYTGRCQFKGWAIRTVGHKWAVSKDEYPRDYYPPYCIGLGYVLSSDVLQNMMRIIPKQPLFAFEDVYVGLILEKLGILPIDNAKYFQVADSFSGRQSNIETVGGSLQVNFAQLCAKIPVLYKCPNFSVSDCTRYSSRKYPWPYYLY